MSDAKLSTTIILQKKFEEEIAKLISPKSKKGSILLRYIDRLLQQYEHCDLEAHDVLVEAYIRGLRYIEKNGEDIRVPEAWMRTAALRVIQGNSKKNLRHDKIKYICSDHAKVEEHPLYQVERSDATEKLKLALADLDAEDRLILELRFDGKAFAQIKNEYFVLKGEEIGEAALRQRSSRALKKLRLKFEELYGKF